MDVDKLRARIRAIVASPADKLVAAFFDPAAPFSGDLFDTLPDNPRDRFSPSDLLAQTLLDVSHKPLAVRELLNGDFSGDLADLRDDIDLWQATHSELAPAYRLWENLVALPGVGPTKASKLLARKRPRLIPIIDSVVRRSYGLTAHDDSWTSLRAALADRQLRDQIEVMRPPGLASTATSLRLLDVAAWMRGSGSRTAKRVRECLGVRR